MGRWNNVKNIESGARKLSEAEKDEKQRKREKEGEGREKEENKLAMV